VSQYSYRIMKELIIILLLTLMVLKLISSLTPATNVSAGVFDIETVHIRMQAGVGGE